MSIAGVLIAIAIVGATGLFIGLFLGLAGKKFEVQVDPHEEEVLGVLPGNNCGACGFPGCSGLAAAIAKGDAPIDACPVGGSAVAEKIGAIMGLEASEKEKQVAFVKCVGDCEKAKQNYEYTGIADCTLLSQMQGGGPGACSYGCLGAGTCVTACPFDAIHLENGIAKVDKAACMSCEKCVKSCPKQLIEMVPMHQRYWVMCNSHDPGKVVVKNCSAGCIACKLCERACEFDAIHVLDNIARIDVEKCTNCGACAEKCPKKVIYQV